MCALLRGVVGAPNYNSGTQRLIETTEEHIKETQRSLHATNRKVTKWSRDVSFSIRPHCSTSHSCQSSGQLAWRLLSAREHDWWYNESYEERPVTRGRLQVLRFSGCLPSIGCPSRASNPSCTGRRCCGRRRWRGLCFSDQYGCVWRHPSGYLGLLGDSDRRSFYDLRHGQLVQDCEHHLHCSPTASSLHRVSLLRIENPTLWWWDVGRTIWEAMAIVVLVHGPRRSMAVRLPMRQLSIGLPLLSKATAARVIPPRHN